MDQLKKIILIDDESKDVPFDENTLLWSRFSETANERSILDVEEQFFLATRAEFLEFIENTGRAEINGGMLRDILRLKDGFSFWWLTNIFERHPSFYGGRLFEIFKLRAFERYMEDKPGVQVALRSKNKELAQALQQWCDRTNRVFEWRRVEAAEDLRPLFWRRVKKSIKNTWPWRALQLVLALKRWWGGIRRLYPHKPRVLRRRGILVGTWFPNFDAQEAMAGKYRSRYWEDAHRLLDETGKYVHWFWINANPPEKVAASVSQREEFRLHDKKSQDFTFWEECVTPLMAIKALVQSWILTRKYRGIFHSLPELCRWPNSAFNFKPLLQPVWLGSLSGFGLLRNLLLYHAVKYYCSSIGAQDVCVTSTELQFWERLLFKFSRENGTSSVLGAVHTRISPADFRYFIAPRAWRDKEFLELMPDKILANGTAALQALSSSGVPQERIGAVEALRFMHLTEAKCNSPMKPQRILVATSYYTENNEVMLKTLALAQQRENLPILNNIYIKPHPICPVENLLEKYFNEAPRQVFGRIEDFLTEGTIVYTDSSTSVAQLALYRSLPLIVHAPENNFDLGSLSDIDNISFVKNSQQFLQSVKACSIIQIQKDYFYLDRDFPRWRRILR
ncbi:TIGR04326 family surface carbohydrate biosynthesis protein [Desulfovibrio sp. SGI.169]|uniref:TIGR04326 family surface carbohydrate biosynthesis protein n=1 Tax=Desulfovibrio sp. SGI.169 TaxID=3420561 RepID=UPI003D0916BC